MIVDKNSFIPAYRQLMEYITAQIRNKEWTSEIPSERLLSEMAGVTRMTVRQAVGELCILRARRAFPHHARLAPRRILQQPIDPLAGGRRRLALHHREVLLHKPMGCHLFVQPGSGFAVLRIHHHAADRLVEAVDDVDAPRAGLLLQQIGHVAPFARLGRRQHADRLLAHHEIFIFKKRLYHNIPLFGLCVCRHSGAYYA